MNDLWTPLLCWLFGHVYEAEGFTGTGVKCFRCGRERRIPGVTPVDVPEWLRRALRVALAELTRKEQEQ